MDGEMEMASRAPVLANRIPAYRVSDEARVAYDNEIGE